MSYYRMHKHSHTQQSVLQVQCSLLQNQESERQICVCVCEREAIIEAKRKMLKAQSAAFKPPHAKLTEFLLSGSSSDRWHHKTTAANEEPLSTDSLQHILNTLNNQKTGYMSSIKL